MKVILWGESEKPLKISKHFSKSIIQKEIIENRFFQNHELF